MVEPGRLSAQTAQEQRAGDQQCDCRIRRLHARGKSAGFIVVSTATREVDRINILRASHRALKRALARLQGDPSET